MSERENIIFQSFTGTLEADGALDTINILGHEGLGIELYHDSGVTGDFSLQISNNASRWYDVTDSSQAADDAGVYWNVSNLFARYARVIYDGEVDANTGYELSVVVKDL